MSDYDEWHGVAGNEVVKCIFAVERADRAVEAALVELRTAQKEHDAAQRDLDVAKRVYFAARVDQENQIRTPKVTPQKREWLKALAAYDAFGAGEMADAASIIGWSPSAGTLRTLASEYQSAGYFISLQRGLRRLDRKRIIEAVGDIFEPTSVSGAPEEVVGGSVDASPIAAHEETHHGQPSDLDDDLDEDMPF